MRKNEAQRYIESMTPSQSGFNPTEMTESESETESKFCKEKWEEIPPQWCETLIESYHMTAVLATKGRTTSY